MKRRASVILGVLLLLLGLGGSVGWRWWNNRAPYGPEVFRAEATLNLADQATADAVLERGNAYVAEEGDQIFLGRVSWDRPAQPQPGNSFRIVVLDKRSHAMPGMITVSSGRPDDVITGTDESLNRAQKRFAWLAGVGGRRVNGHYTNAGSAIIVSSVYAAPITFQAVLRAPKPGTPPGEQPTATAPAAADDLLVALISVGPDRQVYWAQRLLN
jgi:hypothetical protein